MVAEEEGGRHRLENACALEQPLGYWARPCSSLLRRKRGGSSGIGADILREGWQGAAEAGKTVDGSKVIKEGISSRCSLAGEFSGLASGDRV